MVDPPESVLLRPLQIGEHHPENGEPAQRIERLVADAGGFRLVHSVHPQPVTTAPPFITIRTWRTAAMSVLGSPSTATRSASRPGLTAPSLPSRGHHRAFPQVAAISTSAGLTPPAAINSISRAFWPCANTP